jgi:catalase
VSPTPTEVVDAINAVSGAHDGARAAHAKGTLMAATFTGLPGAAALTRAAHFDGTPRRATIRVSNGGGDPGVPDYAREARGIAIKVYVDDDVRTDMVGLTLPRFFVRTVEDFHAFTQARRPDPETGQPDMAAVGAFLEAHPEALPAIQAALGAPPPASYATCRFNGIHTFRWTNADGETRHVRWRLEPDGGTEDLEDDAAKARGRDYLQEEIAGRAGAAFTLSVAIGEDGDAVVDPTEEWPEERERVDVARLELTGVEEGREQSSDDVLVFDPTRVVDGIETTDDPILLFRPRAYAVSVQRRSGAPIPSHLA